MYCEKKNVLFIHVPKTAGSTVELLLEPYLGSSASISQRDITRRDWDDDVEVLVQQKNRNHAKHWTVAEHIQFWQLNNMNAVQSFTIVRNPYERMLKLFLFKIQNGEFVPKSGEPGYNEHIQQRRGKHLTEAVLAKWDHNMFIEFLDAKRDIGRMGSRTFWSAWHHCTLNNQLAVDHVIKYENLSNELPAVFQQMGLDVPTELPVTNSTARIDPEQIKNLYSSVSRKIVEEKYHCDFEHFGYEKWT